MFLVNPEDVPIGANVPEDNLVEVYKTCLFLEKMSERFIVSKMMLRSHRSSRN